MNIETVGSESLLKKLMQLCEIRGEKKALNMEIESSFDEQIAIGREELLRRLSK